METFDLVINFIHLYIFLSIRDKYIYPSISIYTFTWIITITIIIIIIICCTLQIEKGEYR